MYLLHLHPVTEQFWREFAVNCHAVVHSNNHPQRCSFWKIENQPSRTSLNQICFGEPAVTFIFRQSNVTFSTLNLNGSSLAFQA